MRQGSVPTTPTTIQHPACVGDTNTITNVGRGKKGIVFDFEGGWGWGDIFCKTKSKEKKKTQQSIALVAEVINTKSHTGKVLSFHLQPHAKRGHWAGIIKLTDTLKSNHNAKAWSLVMFANTKSIAVCGAEVQQFCCQLSLDEMGPNGRDEGEEGKY